MLQSIAVAPDARTDGPVEVLWAWLWDSPQHPHSSFTAWGASWATGLSCQEVLAAFAELADRGAIRQRRWCRCPKGECRHDLSMQVPYLRAHLDVLEHIGSMSSCWDGPPPDTPDDLSLRLECDSAWWSLRDMLGGQQWLTCTVEVQS